MDDKFSNSIKRKAKSIEKEHDDFFIEQTKDRLLNVALKAKYAEITVNQIAFMDLYVNNQKLSKSIGRYLDLLSDQQYYRDDINEGVMTMVRDLRLPKEDSSNWQLLYETTMMISQDSGPILHLYFDGWNIIDHKIYYWDESDMYDIEEDDDSQ
ncbi:MAG: hypothetical protein Q7U54_18555 [Bacteroidales bacterium]|nr:hypothetical protein [Bacteroidales bacterium]